MQQYYYSMYGQNCARLAPDSKNRLCLTQSRAAMTTNTRTPRYDPPQLLSETLKFVEGFLLFFQCAIRHSFQCSFSFRPNNNTYKTSRPWTCRSRLARALIPRRDLRTEFKYFLLFSILLHSAAARCPSRRAFCKRKTHAASTVRRERIRAHATNNR